MTKDDLIKIQQELGLSDGKMAKSLGLTRQTWRNWRTGRACPIFAQQAIRWMMELRRLSPDNDNLPERVRSLSVAIVAALSIASLTMEHPARRRRQRAPELVELEALHPHQAARRLHGRLAVAGRCRAWP